MKYVIMVMLMASVCVGQTVVDLPSSFNVFRSNEKLACVATATGICYGPTADSMRECSTIPVDIDFVATSWSILNMELDPQGRYVYVAVFNANGLYRFDVENSEWESIRPSTAGTDITALFVDRDGSVVIGTGGRSTSPILARRGMFRSTDHGDTWAEVNTRDSAVRDYPGISVIQSTTEGKLVAGFRYAGTSVQSGIFIQQDTGKWVSVTQIGEPSQMVVRGELIYYVRSSSGFVSCVDLRQVPWTQQGLISTPKRSTIQPWNGDTIAVFLDDETDEQPPEVRLAVDGVVVDTIVLEHRPRTYVNMRFGTDTFTSGASRFIVLGCGQNSIVDAKGADVGELAPGLRLANASEIRQTPTWTSVGVSGHGWYTIGIDGKAELDTMIGLGFQGGSTAFNAYSDGWLKTTQYRLIDIRRTMIDTIVQVDFDTSFRCAVRRDDGSLIAATREAGLVEYIPSTASWKSFSKDGLPDGVAGDSKQSSRISYIFEVDGELYVWVEAEQYPPDTLDGLYVYRSGWSRVDIPSLPDNLNLRSVASDQDGVVLTVSGSFGGFYQESVAIHIQSGRDQPSIFGSQAQDDALMTHAVCSGSTVTWITLHGDVLTSRDPNTEPILVRSGLNSTVGRVGNRLLVATRDSGLFIYDAPSSVDDVDNNARVRVQANPQPASSHITFSTHNHIEQILRTDIYNVAGELVLSLQHEPSNSLTISADVLSSGFYLARVTTTSGHTTVPISILAH
ncbi:MAG TPA: T9SS type A sorting domain-containing protein [Candidatus Didemnitutus sp.]|nr:T9SS type A sorting domain-containing protein [Candidatus Didemnitutus sp.]